MIPPRWKIRNGDSATGLMSRKALSPVGRTFAFGFADNGANLVGIREVTKCLKCKTKGVVVKDGEWKRCEFCKGTKYIDKLS